MDTTRHWKGSARNSYTVSAVYPTAPRASYHIATASVVAGTVAEMTRLSGVEADTRRVTGGTKITD